MDGGNSPITFDNPTIKYGAPVTNPKAQLGTAALADVTTQFSSDEVLIWFGCTPVSKYFSFSRTIYSAGNPANPANLRNAQFGESLNFLTIKTAGNGGTKFGAPTLIISAAGQGAQDDITKAFTAAGFPATAINYLPWPVAEVSLGDAGRITANNDYLTLVARVYKIADASWFPAVQSNFPFVRLTPLPRLTLRDPIALIDSWTPDYNSSSLIQNAEHSYEPLLLGVIQKAAGIYGATYAQIFGNTLTASVTTVQPVRFEDFGAKWIFEKRPGLMGTRDCNYNLVPPQLSQDYAKNTPEEPENAVSVLCGLRSDLSWVAPPPLGAHLPNAVYFNYAFYTTDGGLAGFVLESDVKPLNATLFPEVFSRFGPYAQSVANNFYCHTKALTCTPPVLAASPWGCSAIQNSTLAAGGNLIIGYRAYLNPNTKTTPSDITILKPFIAQIDMIKKTT
jgi:hypothetical protein